MSPPSGRNNRGHRPCPWGSTPRRAMNRGLRMVVVLYAFTALAWAWVNPVFEAPDESFHVGYVNRLVQLRRLPTADDAYAAAAFLASHDAPQQRAHVLDAGQGVIWFHWVHPPLYYLLEALPLAVIYPGGFSGTLIPARPDVAHSLAGGLFQHVSDEWHRWSRPLMAIRLMRLCSIGLSVLTVWATARLAAQMLPGVAVIPWLAAGVYAFTPQFTFMTASVNNDVAGYLAGTVGLLVLVQTAQGCWTPQRAGILLGLSLGLGALSKGTTYWLWPLTALAAVLGYRRWAQRIHCVLVAWLLGAALILPWLLSLGGAYPDALGFSWRGVSSFGSTHGISGFIGQPSEATWAYVGRVLGMLAESVWGQFGWAQVHLDPRLVSGYWLIVLFAVAGWCRRASRSWSLAQARGWRILWAALACFAVFVIIVYARLFIPQGGRYVHAVGSALAVVLSVGLVRARHVVAGLLGCSIPAAGWSWGIVTLMICLNWFVLWHCVYRPYAIAWQTG